MILTLTLSMMILILTVKVRISIIDMITNFLTITFPNNYVLHYPILISSAKQSAGSNNCLISCILHMISFNCLYKTKHIIFTMIIMHMI